MEQDIAAQVVGLGGATDFSLWKLFLRADFVVKFVIILLIACSIFSWALIFDKIRLFKNINSSIEEFEKAINKNPYFPRAYNNLAFVIKKKRSLKEASNILRKGLDNNPEDNSLRYYLADLLNEEGDTIEAKRLFWECVTRNPKDWESKYKLGNLYEKQEKYTLALSMYKKVARDKKNFPLVKIKMADLCKKMGNKKNARIFYRHAKNVKEINPNIPVQLSGVTAVCG